ncbi:MAG: rod shape-determining protein MreC [Flavobacteriales bacterium]|nr:MAG: rod shape-determining protein MreC [Flavobacteriales bacterium]
MQQIIGFILKNKYFLLFFLLELVAITFVIKSHSYHHSKFVNSANAITGNVYTKLNNIKEYTKLKTFNQQLLDENARLKNLLANKDSDNLKPTIAQADSALYQQQFSYLPTKVINNQFNRNYNYLTINVGKSQGIRPDQGVANSKGILGITNTVSNNYATVLSILNNNSKINVKLKNSKHFGTLVWNGKNYNVLQLVDLPIQANISQGDTVITGGMSTIFPQGLPVGTIQDFKQEANAYSTVNIKLFNDMSAIGPAYVITNFDQEEIKEIETTQQQ